MKNELKLPLSEEYEVKLSHKQTVSKKRLYEAVNQFLEENHPGVPGSYIWDYLNERDKGLARVFVLEKDVFTDLRLTDRQSVFYAVTEGGREKELFTKSAFLDNGERRKDKTLLLILSFTVVLILMTVILSCIYLCRQEENVTEEPVREETAKDLTNLTKVIDYCAGIIRDKGGHITYVKSEAFSDQNIEIYVTGCPSYLLVSELEKMEGVKKITAGQTVYTDGKENYLIQIIKGLPRVYQKPLDVAKLLEAGHKAGQFFKQSGAELIMSSLQEDSGRFGLELKADEKILGKVNQAIDEYCLNNSLFVTRFCENLNPQTGGFHIDFEAVTLNEKQKIKGSDLPELLSLSFEKIRGDEVKSIKKESVAKERSEIKEDENLLRGAVKIGSVKNGNEEFYYYRTGDGKITVVKEEK